MGLDIRLPIGLMFGVVGLVLVAYGLFSDPAIYRRSLGINVNLWWGVALVILAAIMLLLARASAKRARPGEHDKDQ